MENFIACVVAMIVYFAALAIANRKRPSED